MVILLLGVVIDGLPAGDRLGFGDLGSGQAGGKRGDECGASRARLSPDDCPCRLVNRAHHTP